MAYWVVKAILRPIFMLVFRTKVTGRGNLPRSGGAVLASNHLSMCDSLFLPVMTRRRVGFLAKSEYFTGRGVRGRLKAMFVTAMGLIPLDRGDSDAAAGALAAGAASLRAGGLLCVYPEGTRSPDGRLFRGRTGAARMAIETGVPVIPVAMVGTDRVLPVGAVRPRLARVEVRIGAPILASPAAEGEEELSEARRLTDRVMDAIAALSGQPRLDRDAAAYKAERRH